VPPSRARAIINELLDEIAEAEGPFPGMLRRDRD
jgi:hypothetical protein